MNAVTSLWALLLHPQGADLLPPARSHTWRAQAESLRGWITGNGCKARIRSPSSLWSSLHQTPVPPATTWADLIAGHTPEDLLAAVRDRNAAEGPGFASWNVRWLVDPHSAQNIRKRQRIRKWLDAGKVTLLQETHWETADRVIWENMFPAATIVASEAHRGAGGVAIVIPPSVEVTHHQVIVAGYAVIADLRYRGQPFRVLSWYLPPGRRNEILLLISQAMPNQGPPLFAGGDLNYHVPSPAADEHDRAQQVRGFLAQRSSMCVEFSGPTHRPTEHQQRCTRQLDAFAVPASAIWKWDVTPCWTDGQSDHAAIVASLHRRRTSDNGGMSPHRIKDLPSVALNDLRSRFCLLERLFDIPPTSTQGPSTTSYNRPSDPGAPPLDTMGINDDETSRINQANASNPERTPSHGHTQHDTDDAQPPLLVGLLTHGRSAMEAMVKGWWLTWRRHKPISLGSLLQEIGEGGAPVRPTGVLRDWLTAQGWQGDLMQAADAERWKLVWAQEQAQDRASAAAPWTTGPTSRRRALADHFRIGRSIFGRLPPIRGVRNECGRLCTDPGEMDEVLWRSREDVWATTPPAPGCGDCILHSYFAGRPNLTHIEVPTWKLLKQTVMDPSGSAPGQDGIPYEVLHHGCAFVSCLLGQAFHAARAYDTNLEETLGPSIDVLVWILKNKDGERPTDMRPLQLPTCIRRLFGAALASVVGPVVEPLMCDDQAAKAGGSCGPNIRRAYQHLEANMGEPGDTGPLWHDMIGSCSASLDAFIEQHLLECGEHAQPTSPSERLERESAVLLADQKQAFERLSIGWFRKVLDGWRFPAWVRRSFMALVEHRSVTVTGRYGLLRRLRRSIGMGGTASPLSWGIAYDPIVEGMSRAISVEAPTYVDDLAGLINGPRQAIRASYYLIWASWAAGLQVTTHTCWRLTYASDSHDLRTACARLPVKTWLSEDGCRHVAGMPPALLRNMLSDLWPVGGHLAVETSIRCTCALKTALVPSRRHARWRNIMVGTPFRDTVVVNTWPYLGAALTSAEYEDASNTPVVRTTPSDPPNAADGGRGSAAPSPNHSLISMGAVVVTPDRAHAPSPNRHATWTADMRALLKLQSWLRSVGRMENRAHLIADANSSVGRRCLMWNSYSDSLIPYPARVVMPDENTVRRMLTAQRIAIQLGTPWCPLHAISALGVVHGVKGAPRCPRISVRTHGAWAHIIGTPWGPAHARSEQRDLWTTAVVHANHVLAHAREDAPDIDASITRAARTIVQTADERFVDPRSPPAQGTGCGLYTILWQHNYAAGHHAWTRERSTARRWCPGDGTEWRTLSAARNITDATRLLRLLCNALPGRARWRSNSQRVHHKCHGCGARPVQLVWRSPSPIEIGDGEDGLAWCSACVQPGMTECSWAFLPERLIPSSLRDQAQLINRDHPSRVDPRPSHFGSCPLCGLGEAGAEHVWQWCCAAHLAWHRCGDGSSWREALAGRGDDRTRLTLVASQVVFLYTSLLDRTTLPPEESARRIVAATLAVDGNQEAHPSGNGHRDENGSLPLDADTWATASGCGRCNRDEGNLYCLTNPSHVLGGAQEATSRARNEVTTAARTAIDTGRIIATLHADNAPARWMVVSSSWWPQPHAAQETRANCEWLTSRCRHCGRHEACLFARRSIMAGEELSVPRALAPTSSAAIIPYEVFFDGATCNRNGDSATGAGALLWYVHSSGPPTCIARAIMASPGGNSAVVAESHACGLALSLLSSLAREHWDTHGSTLRARVIGDCIPVIRYASAQSRLRVAEQRGHIDLGLRQATDCGWYLEWQVVNRRHNSHAHSLARTAAIWANHLYREGRRDVCCVFDWRHDSRVSSAPFTLPAWP